MSPAHDETDPIGEAREKALTFLEYRDRSRREVENRMRRHGYEQSVITDVCAWLTELDLLNDSRFAERYAAEKARAGWGSRRIVSELLKKGVDQATALDVAGRLGANEDHTQGDGAEAPVDLAAMVVRRFGTQLRSEPQKAEKRAAGFLARRGHDWHTIKQVVAEARRRVELGDAQQPPE